MALCAVIATALLVAGLTLPAMIKSAYAEENSGGYGYHAVSATSEGAEAEEQLSGYTNSVLQVNPDYTGRFVTNMSRADFLKGLKLTVYYENGYRDLDLSLLTGSSYVYSTGEEVTIPNDFTFNSAEAEITFPLTVKVEDNYYSVSVTVSLEARQVSSLSISGSYLDENGVYVFEGATSGTSTSTVLMSLLGKVEATYNDGSESILNATSNSG